MNLNDLIRTWFVEHPKYREWVWCSDIVWYLGVELLGTLDHDRVRLVDAEQRVSRIYAADPTLFDQIEARIKEIIANPTPIDEVEHGPECKKLIYACSETTITLAGTDITLYARKSCRRKL